MKKLTYVIINDMARDTVTQRANGMRGQRTHHLSAILDGSEESATWHARRHQSKPTTISIKKKIDESHARMCLLDEKVV